MSKMKEKMKEVNEHVVDVEATEVTETMDETENEEFMTVRVPKAKGYEMLANGEASEVEIKETEPEEEPKGKKKIFTKDNLKKVGKIIAITATAAGAVATGVAIGRNKKKSDDVTFESAPPQGLPDNGENENVETTYETENDEIDIEI